MNIDDVKEVRNDGRDRLLQIFDRQRELMSKYCDIEKSNGLRLDSGVPVDIHSHKGQYTLKDFAWRVTEELMESYEAQQNEDLHHAQEELADAFHFLVELAILSGISHSDIPGKGDGLDKLFDHHEFRFQRASITMLDYLGRAMNCLKNKPWKQTQILTDVERYRNNIIQAFLCFGDVCWSLEMESDDLFNFYFKKSEVNKFRQRSQY